MASLKGKTVLVTGADGFIGSHLTERLVTEEAHVRAFCLYNSQGSWGWLDEAGERVRQRIDVRLGDIRDRSFVERACEGVDVVFHLAALIAIPYSYVAVESFVETNIDGTLNVLEACRRSGVKLLVHTSTSEVYGTPKSLPIRETHPLNAQSPYAATKVAADQLVLSYQRSFDIPAVVLRPFNTFGPRQSARAVLPAMCSQLLAGKTEVELGRLDTKRDLTFVTDTVDAFVRAALATGIVGQTIQLGTGRSVSIGELFEIACRALSVRANVTHDARRLRPEASEVETLESDPTLAREKLGWMPRVTIEEGVAKTLEWMKHHLDRFKVGTLHL